MNLTYYKDISFSEPKIARGIQQDRLREHLIYCKMHSPYYSKALKRFDIGSGFAALDKLHEFPCTDKSDLEKYNDDFCAVSQSKIVDIVLSSGTTGKPIKVMYSDYDLKRLAYNEEKSFRACGVLANDIVLLTCTMDRCFIAGLAYFLGIRAIGASTIRNGHGSMESHMEIISKMNPTVIVGVPTFLRKLGLYMQEKKRDPGKTSVLKLVCIGEPLRDEKLRLLKITEDIESIWQAKAFSTYASSETATTFCECIAQLGGHLHQDLAILEIIDEKSVSLAPGNIGEVVITPLGVEGMPLVRFKTGDISFLINEPCSCGRLSPRLGPILGRKKQMMKLRGTTLYPQAVYSILEDMDLVSEYYIVATSESNLSDCITVYCSVKDKTCTVEMIQDKLQARLRVKPSVVLDDEERIKQQVYAQKSRKPVRFIDKR